MTMQNVVADGKKVYERIQPVLELKFPNQYVTIDPVSKEYFISPSMGGALAKATARFPRRQFYTTQIGKDTAMRMAR